MSSKMKAVYKRDIKLKEKNDDDTVRVALTSDNVSGSMRITY
jgi:hypothetical protein